MSTDYRPAWVDKFTCMRGCKPNITLRYVNRTPTGVNISTYTCECCHDVYFIRWTDERPSEFTLAKRHVMSRGKNGRTYARVWDGFDLPDDLALRPTVLASGKHA